MGAYLQLQGDQNTVIRNNSHEYWAVTMNNTGEQMNNE